MLRNYLLTAWLTLQYSSTQTHIFTARHTSSTLVFKNIIIRCKNAKILCMDIQKQFENSDYEVWVLYYAICFSEGPLIDFIK